MHAHSVSQPVSQPWPQARVAVLACLLLGFCGEASAISDGQTPSSGAWEYLQRQFYPDRSLCVLDENFMSL